MLIRSLKLIILDVVSCIASLYLAYYIRFEFSIPNEYNQILAIWALIFTAFQGLTFYLNGIYARIYRYTSLFDLFAIIKSVSISSSISILLIFFVMGAEGYPRSTLILYYFFNIILTSFSRIAVRVYYSHYYDKILIKKNINTKKLILIGAGKTGAKITREVLNTSGEKYSIVGFADDDSEKQGALLHGVKVLCKVVDIPNLKIEYDEVLITAPSATGGQIRHIIKACKQTGKRYKIVPGLNELLDKDISLETIRDVSYQDILGREEVKLNMNSIEKLLLGKRILITGAGGSIGSELVNQCLKFSPAEIICLDQSEEKIFELDQKYKNSRFKTIIKTVLASINNKMILEKAFLENQPNIVFHAAAYKHVPIQELHPWNAVQTNIKGSLNLITLSDKYKVNKFVLVSTDKAVNPVNVMGATKRIAEKLVQSFNKGSDTCFMSVRFGNVLGSSGSAIPIFQNQINSGKPITITHPEMSRYFMSIQEASQLILQCGAYGKDGEIFLLEMGNPIKIVQMAKDMIRLSGLEPEVDIPIVFTGLRPGEKLYEELRLTEEIKVPTEHQRIVILKEEKIPEPWESLNQRIQALFKVSEQLDIDNIIFSLKNILPSYQPRGFESNEIPSNNLFKIKVEA
jgi:FlaA1/EpsC-like NDP-sugar epimerase